MENMCAEYAEHGTATHVVNAVRRVLAESAAQAANTHLTSRKSFSEVNVGIGKASVFASGAGRRVCLPWHPLSPGSPPVRPRPQASTRSSQLTTDATRGPAQTAEQCFFTAHFSVQERVALDQMHVQHRLALHDGSLQLAALPPSEAADASHPAVLHLCRLSSSGPVPWDGRFRGVLVNSKNTGAATREVTKADWDVWRTTDRRRRGTLANARDYEIGHRNVGRSMQRAFRARYGPLKAGSGYTASLGGGKAGSVLLCGVKGRQG